MKNCKLLMLCFFEKFLVCFLLVFLCNILGQSLYAQMVHPVAAGEQPKFTVAIVPHESYADLKVYRADSTDENLKKNIGYWFITASKDSKAIPINWISDPITADLKIVLVTYPERAGWINKSKKSLLKQ
ncbi:MAG: hypothetical protein CFE25_04990 [Chitinophagaceae bacterium BSSC1]|nr:MAG: hypothetical protein CFE25_04990 [Chitinophagaceae bacterium BSSC1]